MKLPYILFIIACIAVIAVISVYNRFDRRAFGVDRLWHSYRAELARWVELAGKAAAALPDSCGADAETLAAGYPKLRNVRKKAELVSTLYAATVGTREAAYSDPAVGELLEEKLDVEESLIGFCMYYAEKTADFNARLEKPPAGPLAARLGFRPFPPIDFIGTPKSDERHGSGPEGPDDE